MPGASFAARIVHPISSASRRLSHRPLTTADFDANQPNQEIVGGTVRIENPSLVKGESLNRLYRALSNAAGHESRVSTAP
jgi:hypothetical protein